VVVGLGVSVLDGKRVAVCDGAGEGVWVEVGADVWVFVGFGVVVCVGVGDFFFVGMAVNWTFCSLLQPEVKQITIIRIVVTNRLRFVPITTSFFIHTYLNIMIYFYNLNEYLKNAFVIFLDVFQHSYLIQSVGGIR
jgi:hypothetical protein